MTPGVDSPVILITNKNLVVQGDPITEIKSIDGTLNWNEPDSFAFTVPAYPAYMDYLVRGNRAVLIDQGKILTAGPIEKPGGYSRSVSEEPDPGVITINFADDLARIAGLLCYPDPAHASTAQTTAYYETSGNAETLMRTIVNLNAGPGALAARKVEKLILGSVAGVGTSVRVKERFTPLGEVLRNLASAGGDLGFDTKQVGTDIVFSVFASADKTKLARFSWGMGNVRSISLDSEAPTATTAVVGGTGEAATRTIVERNNSSAESSWYRVETFVDAAQQDDTTTASLQQAGDNALAEAGEKVSLSVIVVDTEDVSFGNQYNLGDTVTVETLPGIEVADKVRSVKYTYTPKDGRQFSALVGSISASSDRNWIRYVHAISSRLGTLERR